MVEKSIKCDRCPTAQLPLHRAAATGHLTCLKALLKQVENGQNVLDIDGNTILHAAAAGGQPETVRYLQESTSLTSHVKNRTGQTPTIVAAQRRQLNCVKLILGGALNESQAIALETDNQGCTVLHLAVLTNDNDTALWLLRRFGKPIANCANFDGVLPLHIASAQGNIEFIQIATKYDVAMANGRDRNGAVPSFYAVQAGHLRCVRYLVEKVRADIRTTTNRGQSLFHAACLGGHLHIVMWLLAQMDRNSIYWPTLDLATPFHCGAYGGHVEVISFLYKISGNNKKFLLNALDRRGNTVLHLAALKNRITCVQYLIEMGANPNVRNKADKSALEIAQSRGYHQVTSLLTAASAKKKKRRFFGRAKSTPNVIQTSRGTSGYGSTLSAHSSDMGAAFYSSSPIGAEPSSGYGSSSSENINRLLHSPEQKKGKVKSHESFSKDTNWMLIRPASQATYESIGDPVEKRNINRVQSAISDCLPYGWEVRTRRSIYLDSACQTDKDSLDDNVILSSTQDPSLKKQGSNVTVTTAVIHQSASPDEQKVERSRTGPALAPPVIYDPKHSKKLLGNSKSVSMGDISVQTKRNSQSSDLFRSLATLNEQPDEHLTESNRQLSGSMPEIQVKTRRPENPSRLRYFGASIMSGKDLRNKNKNPHFQSLQAVNDQPILWRPVKRGNQITCRYTDV